MVNNQDKKISKEEEILIEEEMINLSIQISEELDID